jgi:hypothetical protein
MNLPATQPPSTSDFMHVRPLLFQEDRIWPPSEQQSFDVFIDHCIIIFKRPVGAYCGKPSVHERDIGQHTGISGESQFRQITN